MLNFDRITRTSGPFARLACALALLAVAITPTVLGAGPEFIGARADAATTPRYLVGRGVADITGESEDSDKDGYNNEGVVTHGIHTRLRARAFIAVDRSTGKRVAIAIADIDHPATELWLDIIAGVQRRLGPAYTRDNVVFTTTHTHSSPGGYSHDNLYNFNSQGYRKQNYDAIVAGTIAALVRAHRDLAPGRLTLNIGSLTNASVNRSRDAFNLNPASDKSFFPNAIDPQTTTLGLRRNGAPVGSINWFATHGTSMARQSTYVSGDNKGYAAYHWEREVSGVDYLSTRSPSYVAGFAQTNSGDMTPNLALHEGTGPTNDYFKNTKIIGTRQYAKAKYGVDHPTAQISGPIDSRFTYINIGDTTVSPAYTGDGRTHHTCSAAMGAGFLAGSKEDGPGLAFLNEGEGNNPLVGLISDALYIASPKLKACQAPKDILVPGGDLGVLPNVLPIQLVRIGQLYLTVVPQEFTIVSGLRLRRTVASIVKAPLSNVIVAGYSNGYGGYVTTPEEYEGGDYEAGHTLYGKWTLPAYQQSMAALARDMVATRPTAVTVALPPTTPLPAPRTPWYDATPLGKKFGAVSTQPRSAYTRGQQVKAAFVGANPNNNLKHGSTYVTVDRYTPTGWKRVQDDGDWGTKFQWAKGLLGTSTFTVTWDIPANFPTGAYRISYRGNARPLLGSPVAFTGTTRTFRVN